MDRSSAASVILSYCSASTTIALGATGTRWNRDVRRYWACVKQIALHQQLADRTPACRTDALLIWLASLCVNLRVLDLRWCTCSPSAANALVKASRLLEVYLGTQNYPVVFQSLLSECPRLSGLVLQHNIQDWTTLAKFRRLRAIEIGQQGVPLFEPAGNELRHVLALNSSLEIVHILGHRNGFSVLDSLNPSSLKSLALPYEPLPISEKKIRALKPFVNLVNLNLGQSEYVSAKVLTILGKQELPHLKRVSFYAPPTIARPIATQMADGTLFSHLTHFGCRNQQGSHDVLLHHPRIQVFDYERSRNSAKNWCFPVFCTWTLMKLFGANPHGTGCDTHKE